MEYLNLHAYTGCPDIPDSVTFNYSLICDDTKKARHADLYSIRIQTKTSKYQPQTHLRFIDDS